MNDFFSNVLNVVYEEMHEVIISFMPVLYLSHTHESLTPDQAQARTTAGGA